MTLHTHCLRCGKKLTSTTSQRRGYGWECWKKLQDDVPGLFDDVSENEADKIKGQSISRPCKTGIRARQPLLCGMPQVGRRWRKASSRLCRPCKTGIRARQPLLCGMPQVGRRWRKASSRLLQKPRRQRYFRQHGIALQRMPLCRTSRQKQR